MRRWLRRYYVPLVSISTTYKSTAGFLHRIAKPRRHLSRHSSTPFEADFFSNPFENSNTISSLSVDSDIPLVLGLNKYSHDTSICAADARTGQVLFGLAKERLSRRKHDGGNVATLVDTCLEALDLSIDNIKTVVCNNHHHRIAPLEANVRHMEWEANLRINGGAEDGYDEVENTLPNANFQEISHHLAHAYSTATQAPFDTGLIVVMDGMGETFRAMYRAYKTNDLFYTSDLSQGLDQFECIPHDLLEQAQHSHFDWREAESVYNFTKNTTNINIQVVFKRFTCENSPPALYNHGFENMDSLGAVYSRASSHIFGDWNACGKVMGLAPWGNFEWKNKKNETVRPERITAPIMWGKLYEEGGLQINRTLLEGVPLVARNDPDLFSDNTGSKMKRYDFDEETMPCGATLEAIALAHRIQIDLETVGLDFVRHWIAKTNSTNLCLAGGVALNSVMNGRFARELGLNQTFVSPYPGDDGIAVGCCAFGLFGDRNRHRRNRPGSEQIDAGQQSPQQPLLWRQPLSPYLGPYANQLQVQQAIQTADPWLEVEIIKVQDHRLQAMAEEIESGGVVAWYRSRSELGPRALGHRSILADPRKKGLVSFINQAVKRRESFRPFAPSVLVDEARNWFELGASQGINQSPYMSITAMVHKDMQARIPAVTHVDGSSRLQTVTDVDEPIYHSLITKFFAMTGVPMILNTSFNTLPGEPIVESPVDAIRSFLCSMGSIEMLVMDDYVIKRKEPDLRRLLGEATQDGEDYKTEPTFPKRTGAVEFKSSLSLNQDATDDDAVETITRISMPARPMHCQNGEWFELLDELEGEILSACNGATDLNGILAVYTSVPEEETIDNADIDEAQTLLQNIVHRLVRLYEHTFINW